MSPGLGASQGCAERIWFGRLVRFFGRFFLPPHYIMSHLSNFDTDSVGLGTRIRKVGRSQHWKNQKKSNYFGKNKGNFGQYLSRLEDHSPTTFIFLALFGVDFWSFSDSLNIFYPAKGHSVCPQSLPYSYPTYGSERWERPTRKVNKQTMKSDPPRKEREERGRKVYQTNRKGDLSHVMCLDLRLLDLLGRCGKSRGGWR